MTNIELCEINLKQAQIIDHAYKEIELLRQSLRTSEKINSSLVEQVHSLEDINLTLHKSVMSLSKAAFK